MAARLRKLPPLAWAAIAAGALGYVLTFYVRSELWPWVGVLLMLLPFTAAFSYADGQKSSAASNISCTLLGVKP